ncbi:hypothetical protein EDD66_10340 [Mobilisporobacter senegalensis]|uniref:Uncharacterized protein n=1 Tax=Mobilisporobacter senegalensis TaxID=1329262 RepID=A0A3N1XR50_9FIRM|nr:hypothetical protein EDD66_10340 [Mobilisporobacter senegalensis]
MLTYHGYNARIIHIKRNEVRMNDDYCLLINEFNMHELNLFTGFFFVSKKLSFFFILYFEGKV